MLEYDAESETYVEKCHNEQLHILRNYKQNWTDWERKAINNYLKRHNSRNDNIRKQRSIERQFKLSVYDL
jgi:hypothetical protein